MFARFGTLTSFESSNNRATTERSGAESVYHMLTWEKGRFHFTAMDIDMEDQIQSSTTSLLMEGARLIDEANR